MRELSGNNLRISCEVQGHVAEQGRCRVWQKWGLALQDIMLPGQTTTSWRRWAQRLGRRKQGIAKNE